MTSVSPLLICALVLMLVTAALVREMRSRRALERLLRRLLSLWRKQNAGFPSDEESVDARGVDRRSVGRLRR